jgi:uncharacterized protein (TIGR00156 family)
MLWDRDVPAPTPGPLQGRCGLLPSPRRGVFPIFFIMEHSMKRIFFACLIRGEGFHAPPFRARLLIVMLTFVGSLINAQEGFRGPGPDIVTVAAAKVLRDDYPVALRGRIDRFLGDEKYLFIDETGSIIVEIDHKLWQGLSVDQNDTVEILGEVDKEFTRTKIDASSIKKL